MNSGPQDIEPVQAECERLRDELAQARHQLQCINEVVRDIASLLDLEKILQLVADKARELIGAEKMIVPIIDADRQVYTYMAASGRDANLVFGQSFSVTVGMCGWVLSRQESLFFGEGSEQLMGRQIAWKQGMESALLVPLMSRGKIVGGLSGLGKLGGGSFTPNDQALLQMFASHISIAIENAMIFRQIEKQKAQLQSILDNSSSVIYIKDLDGLYILINRQYEKLFHVRNDEIRGKTDYDIFPVEFAEKWAVNDQYVMRSGKSIEIEESAPMDDGEHTYLSVKFPLHDGNNHIYAMCGISTDITEHRRTEEALRRSQKMEAIGQLTGGIAHDFNNQLGIVIGYMDMLGDAVGHEAGPAKMLQTATRAVLRCTDLTRQLLSFSRKQSKDRVELDINDALNEIRELFSRSVTPQIRVHYDLSDGPQHVMCNKGEFQDAVLNLVLNARDAMPQGGVVEIMTRTVFLDAQQVRKEFDAQPGQYIRLSVTDQGTGMSRDVMDRIFEPFFTTKAMGKGTGLGLAMVYGFVKRNQGQVNVYSEPGLGTTINMYLPLCDAVDHKVQTEDRIPPAGRAGNEKILVVDDDADLLEVTVRHLADLGYRHVQVRTARAALEVLKKHDDIDLLLTDVVMPEMDGCQLAEMALQVRPELKVLLTSGFMQEQLANTFCKTHLAGLLQKPYRKDELAGRLRQLLDRISPHAEN